ncbi:MAG: 50S ribosomal protein L11 methyltransferase [Planctomycetota bacterium]|jgi:2-polyprenyl-3-methyl-5-hydroxy-6-metoxy-1,4-benzoquinol methylase
MSAANQSAPRGATVDVPGAGACLLPREFEHFTGAVGPAEVEVRDARERPSEVHAALAAGRAVVLSGPYRYIDGVYRYCQRFERKLVPRSECAHIEDRAQRSAAFTEARRRKLHRLLVLARGDELVNVTDPPETAGLQDWLEAPTGDETYLIPVRRLQRILTDMRRAREGIEVDLVGRITILPHVYVPADRSVPAMFAAERDLISDRRVLDVGTGTGVLALLAARLGASGVVATDSNPWAVRNARLNAERLGLDIDVRGPADLYGAVAGERFDTILFNAPWIRGEPRTLYDTANFDPGQRVLEGFLRGARAHLAREGAVLLQYSDVSQRKGEASLDRLRELVRECGLRIARERALKRVGRVLGARESVYLYEIRAARE